MGGDLLTLFLCGDVMLGRGVDQILPHPGDPALREGYLRDARAYVELAAARNGPIPYPAGFSWPWGDALEVLDEAAPAARVLNLETSITQYAGFAPEKEIHYRMNPANLPCLAAARPDVCVLANNHVLDFGRPGLSDTLGALADAGLRTAGAGADTGAACRPAVLPVADGRRILVFSFGMPSSGIPREWAAAGDRSGVDFVAGPAPAAAGEINGRVQQWKRPGDLAVASVHWGANWGYHVSRSEAAFAHALLEGGVDIVHGHSSHHPRALEAYRGSSPSTDAATSSMTTRASPATRSTGTTCGRCTSSRWNRTPAGSTRCGSPRCRPGACGCGMPRAATPGGCKVSSTESAPASVPVSPAPQRARSLSVPPKGRDSGPGTTVFPFSEFAANMHFSWVLRDSHDCFPDLGT